MVIKPGESSHITATFSSAGKKGHQNKTITVITNDVITSYSIHYTKLYDSPALIVPNSNSVFSNTILGEFASSSSVK